MRARSWRRISADICGWVGWALWVAVGRGGVNEGGDEGMETREKGDVDEWIQCIEEMAVSCCGAQCKFEKQQVIEKLMSWSSLFGKATFELFVVVIS